MLWWVPWCFLRGSGEGEGAGSGLPPSVGRRHQWGRWREHFKGGAECSGGSLGASCVEVE